MARRKALDDRRGLTPHGFQRLLEWLDDGTESRGETYLEIRRRLVWYFERRNRRAADDLADETLNRVGLTLESSGTIAVTPPARYCYVVARYVLLEDLRRDPPHVPLHEPSVDAGGAMAGTTLTAADDQARFHELQLECLDRCLAALKPEQRDLVVDYYRGDQREKIERRRELARRLNISMNALAIRACRIRDTLEACVGACCRERRQV